MKSIFTLLLIFITGQLCSAGIPGTAAENGLSPQLRTNLYIVSPENKLVLMDGTLSLYGEAYSNGVDRYDARKMSNPGENWGMLRDERVLVVERMQPLTSSDTIFFTMWNMRKIHYRLHIITKNWKDLGIPAYLHDDYLETLTPISLSGLDSLDFEVNNDPASYAADRFMLVFGSDISGGALPLDFVSTRAFLHNTGVSILWQTENVKNVAFFTVERSVNGVDFDAILSPVSPENLSEGQYEAFDKSPAPGTNYYRIRSTDIDGRNQYGSTVEVNNLSKSNYTLYPNPATAGHLKLLIPNALPGKYEIRWITGQGSVRSLQTVKSYGGQQRIQLQLPNNISRGVYHLEITAPNGNRKVLTVIF